MKTFRKIQTPKGQVLNETILGGKMLLSPRGGLSGLDLETLHRIGTQINQITGIQLTGKLTLIESRVLQRAIALGYNDLSSYLAFFRTCESQEISNLISLLTTHTTQFFRESAHFDLLADSVLPELRNENRATRIWCAACSTGEEAYSIAITSMESTALSGETGQFKQKLEIVGTDVSRDCIRSAQFGVYKAADLCSLRSHISKKYFDFGAGELKGWVKAKDSIHSLCRFKVENLLTDAQKPAENDVVFLRNVLIYFHEKDQARIVYSVMSSLKVGGYLFLSHTESLSQMPAALKSLGNSVYRKQKVVRQLKSSMTSKEVATHLRVSGVRSQPGKSLLVLGASTGGVLAVQTVMSTIARNCPPIVIAMHLPANFLGSFLESLRRKTEVSVVRAENGMSVEPGKAYLAPGGMQTKVLRNGDGLYLDVREDRSDSLYKPSIDTLFESIVPICKAIRVSAVLMTGMGSDGATGLLQLRKAGAHTIAQDKGSSLVFGMPKAAIEMGAAVEVVSLKALSQHWIEGLEKKDPLTLYGPARQSV